MKSLKGLIDRTKEVENCLICVLRTSIETAPWIFPYDGYCKHSLIRHSESSHIRRNVFWCWVPCLFLILNTVGWLYNLYFLWIIYGEDEVHFLVLLSDALFSFSGITMYAAMLFKGNHIITVFAITGAIIDGGSGVGNTNYLSPYCRKVMHIRCQLERYFIYLVHATSLLAVFVFLCLYGFNTEALSVMLNCASVTSLLTEGIVMVKLHGLLLHIVGVEFENVCDDLEDPTIMNAADEILRKNIKSHLQLITALKLACDNLAAFMDPGTIVYILTAIAVFIVDIYLFILPWNDYYGLYIGYQQIRTLVLVVLLIQLIKRMDLTDVSMGVLSFLYKYPISKLTRQQADQVEMLSICLETQRPRVIASDSVFISKRLAATIIGTVVTYVLVALQFRAARTRDE